MYGVYNSHWCRFVYINTPDVVTQLVIIYSNAVITILVHVYDCIRLGLSFKIDIKMSETVIIGWNERAV